MLTTGQMKQINKSTLSF